MLLKIEVGLPMKVEEELSNGYYLLKNSFSLHN